MAQIRHLAFLIDDPKRVAEFYHEVFGMKMVGEGPPGVYWITDGHIEIALIPNAIAQEHRMYPSTRGLNHFGFTLEPDEKAEVVRKLLERGIEPRSPGPGRPYAEEYALDPEFNRFDLSTSKIKVDESGTAVSKT